MPITKNALLRYKILDECFSNRYKCFFIEDLISICSERISEFYGIEKSVSRRQIFEDIKFMESVDGYDAPIEHLKEGKRVFYRYEDPNFSIFKKPFNIHEVETITEAIEIFSRIQGLEWADSLKVKFDSSIKTTEKIIDFEENKFLKGLKFLNPLYQYIVNKQGVEVEYKPFTEEVKQFVISPYYLKQYNNRWFLLGQNHTENYLQTLALDRIKNIERSKEYFIRNSIDFEEYFEEIVGVTNFQDKEIQEVIILLSEDVIPYVSSKPLHSTQQIKGNILTICVKLNYELETLLLSFGEKMKVLAPADLKNRIYERLQNSVNQYIEL